MPAARLFAFVARRLSGACLLALVLGFWSAPAIAGFTVCNQTLDVVNVAIGSQEGNTFTTRGWWTVGTNQCAHVIKGDLATRFVYVYAEDVFGRQLLSGGNSMCIGTALFSIDATDQCWQRGFKAANFLEVDTRMELNWTLFLDEQGP